MGVVIPLSLVLILLGDAMMRAHTEAVNITGASHELTHALLPYLVAQLTVLALILAAPGLVWQRNPTTLSPAASEPANEVAPDPVADPSFDPPPDDAAGKPGSKD